MKSATAITPASADNSAELVGRIRTGDTSAWRDLVDQYEPLLRWLARNHRLSAEDADDAVQLTWLRCLEHIGQLSHADRLRAWLITICRRESIRLAIKGRRDVLISEPEAERLIDDGTTGLGKVIRAPRLCAVTCTTACTLPSRLYRSDSGPCSSNCSDQEGQSYCRLSHRLGLPVGSVGPTRQRALTRLRNDPRLADLSSEDSDRRQRIRSA